MNPRDDLLDQITLGLPEDSSFPILTNDPVIDYFSCLSTLIDPLTPQLNVFYTFTKNDVMLLCSVAKSSMHRGER